MNIAVLSDIHLGRGDDADRRRGQDQELLRLLDYLEMHYDRIILLGDIWELLTPKCPGMPKRELKIVRTAHPQLAQRFTQAPYQYIAGNHDYVVEKTEGVPKELTVKLDQLSILFTHGHQFDIWSKQLRYIGELVVWTSGWAARFGTQAFTRFFDRLHNLLTGTSVNEQLSSMELKLIDQSIKHNHQVTVIGHTHLPGIIEHEGHLLVNSGHCLGSFLHFVSINTRQSLVTVYRVQQSQTEAMNENNFDIIDQVALPQAMNRVGL